MNKQPQPVLTERWTRLKYHEKQDALWRSSCRFRVVPAGRRSGKTEIAKRFLIMRALSCMLQDGTFVCAAPTNMQAKRIFWNDLKKMIPSSLIIGKANETETTIKLYNGTKIIVTGLDVPERLEGFPIDGIVIDEYGNSKKSIWGEHIRPALSTIGREGWAWLIGVPEGRNHYWDMAMRAESDTTGTWGYYHWKSSDILSAEEIQAAKLELDELTFNQEYNGDFVDFEGRAYYSFSINKNSNPVYYQKHMPLIFCFDFNVSPGVCVIAQEQANNGRFKGVDDNFTAVVGEVWIPQNSTTPAVCRKLIDDWDFHEGTVEIYGDASGGARGTAKVHGSDWDIIQEHLKPVFGSRLKMRVPKANPAVRSRINAVNTRCETASGNIRLLINPETAPHVIKDLEGVMLKQGTTSDLEKGKDSELSHISDALGYYIFRRFPVRGRSGNTVTQI